MELTPLLKRLVKYKLRLNLDKCVFKANLRKLLDFIVNQRGINVDLAKVQAIKDMLVPKTEKQVRSFLGRIAYIACFIA